MKRQPDQRDRRRASGGFTLVEIMVAAAVGMLVIAMSMSSFLALSRAAAGSVNAASVHSQLRIGMDRVTSDLIGASAITTWYPKNYIIFNALTPSGSESRILYHYKYGKLFYTLRGGKWTVLIENVDDVTFTLYDADGDETTVPVEAVSVGVKISGTRQWARESYSDEVYARVMLRNKAGG